MIRTFAALAVITALCIIVAALASTNIIPSATQTAAASPPGLCGNNPALPPCEHTGEAVPVGDVDQLRTALDVAIQKYNRCIAKTVLRTPWIDNQSVKLVCGIGGDDQEFAATMNFSNACINMYQAIKGPHDPPPAVSCIQLGDEIINNARKMVWQNLQRNHP